MIEVIELTKKFGNLLAVDQVNFSVKKGDVLGFLGPNGAGKSTTIKMIAGFIEGSKGSVKIDGKDVFEFPIESKQKIGYMPESNPIYKDMTALEFLRFIAEAHDVANIDQAIERTIKLANLEDVKTQTAETLSKGYKTRLSFAAAIIHDPPILLLDEPTDGLDPNQKKEIRGLIKSLSKDKAIVVSTHILEEVEAMCNRVIIISEGKLVLNGTPADLRARCDHDKKIIISIDESNKSQVERLLNTSLAVLQPAKESFNRYLCESACELDKVKNILSENKIKYEELFYFDAPLDEAFHKITRTKE